MNEETPYSKRELDEKFLNVEEALDNHLVVLGRIETKVSATNGSIAAVKIEQARQAGYNKAMAVAASAGFMVLVAVLGWLIPQFVNLKVQVVSKQTLEDAVSSGVTSAMNQFIVTPAK